MEKSKIKLWQAELDRWLDKKSLKQREVELTDETLDHPILVSNEPIGTFRILLDSNWNVKMASQNLTSAMIKEPGAKQFEWKGTAGIDTLNKNIFKHPDLVQRLKKQFNLVSNGNYQSAETKIDLSKVGLPERHPLNGKFHSLMYPLSAFAKRHFIQGWCVKEINPDSDWLDKFGEIGEIVKKWDHHCETVEKEFWDARKGWVVWNLTTLGVFGDLSIPTAASKTTEFYNQFSPQGYTVK